MIWPSDAFAPDLLVFRGPPIDDPLPQGVPIIDDPSREVPVVDPGRRDAPEPVREPEGAPSSDPLPE
jgi:hypothetical protein